METILQRNTCTVTIGPQHPLVIIGERINPTGRKKLACALEKGELDLVRDEAVKQVAAGAHVLDVNVGVSGIDEPGLLRDAVKVVCAAVAVPLCIDSALPSALAAGLSVYEGKALVNSVNGEERKLKEVLPIVKHYGAAVVGLTMDDDGIPRDAGRRLAIAEKIVNAAQKEGIPIEDVIIDPLAMAVSTDSMAAVETLKAISRVREKLGVNQTLGASNISFGLPERHAVNALFTALAVANGVTCPILDPTVWDIRRAALLTDLLLGKDEWCMNFISVYREKFPLD
ncbi:MAG: dihydropteroate synthase [Desulfobacterales bacterium]|jgi:5-methyltetrahydrofolate--homocysteine methyltransferase|nr:dihydropteroate synthase [Desulfobacterales bacterium]